MVLFSSLFPVYPKVFPVLFEVFLCLEVDKKATFIMPTYGDDITAKINNQEGTQNENEQTTKHAFGQKSMQAFQSLFQHLYSRGIP